VSPVQVFPAVSLRRERWSKGEEINRNACRNCGLGHTVAGVPGAGSVKGMAASVYVVARYLAKSGHEDEVRGVLNALIAPSRGEVGCYQYDLLQNSDNPRDFCFVERWEDDQAFAQHSATEHVKTADAGVEGLVEVPPDVRSYGIL
jgi:quinol monooxygenase YgiN